MRPDLITQKNAVRIITQGAKDYEINLRHNIYLFLFRDITTNMIDYIELIFPIRNYMHLTGVTITDKEGNVLPSTQFYKQCLENRIQTNQITFKDDGTTTGKLKLLPNLTKMVTSANLTVIYNSGRPYLKCERLVGKVNFCLAITKDRKYYVPVSCIDGDIRDFGNNPSKILAIFSKPVFTENKYRKIRYLSKKTNLFEQNIPDNLMELLDLSDYKP